VKTLLSGRQVASGSEEWRHECEARHLAFMELPDRETQLRMIESRRGQQAAIELRKTIGDVIAANNSP
jgi:hypothetical protein